jgi:hypothetical protein
MFYPVPGSVLSKGEVLDTALVKTSVELKEDAEADLRKKCMCRPWEEVVEFEAGIGGKAVGDEELLDRVVRELRNTGTVYFGERD